MHTDTAARAAASTAPAGFAPRLGQAALAVLAGLAIAWIVISALACLSGADLAEAIDVPVQIACGVWDGVTDVGSDLARHLTGH
jgi:hypothetical protein